MKNTVDLVGAFDPTLFGFNAFPKGVKPRDRAAQVAHNMTEILRLRQTTS
jgi:hypothetical protein